MASSSSLPLKQLFAKFPIRVDTKFANDILRWKLLYEARPANAEVLNTSLLGVTLPGFFPKDAQALFDICRINRDEFKRAIKQSSIPPKFHVVSDEFNLLTVWVGHNVIISSAVSRDLKDKVIVALFMMLMYKFFSGSVRHMFPHTANRAVMETTIDNLTDKFDIKHRDTNTWKLIIQKRAELLTESGEENIHYNSLINFTPDSKVIYILSDIQTRIRTRVGNIATIYYETHAAGNSIIDSTLTSEDKDGKKTIKELQNSFDQMISSICNRVLNAQRFISNDYVKIVCGICSNIRPEMMRNVLMQFSALATFQYNKGKSDSMDKTGQYYQGYHILISNLIQRTYRTCIVDRVPLQRAPILKRALNLYRSSRISDPEIQKIKDSVSVFVDATKVSSRSATNSSLKIAFILYIIMMSFDVD